MNFSFRERNNKEPPSNDNSDNFDDYEVSDRRMMRSTNDPYFNAYDESKRNFSREIERSIDLTVGEKVPKIQKTQLLNSLLILARKQTDRLIDDFEAMNRNYSDNQPFKFNQQAQSLNIYIINPQASSYFPQNNAYLQFPMQSIQPQNFFSNQYQQFSPNQNLLGVQNFNQFQPIQNPNFFNGPIYPTVQKTTPTKNKSKDHKKSKESKKSKENKKKKESKKSKKSKKSEKSKKDSNIQTFDYQVGQDFNGIIKYLTDKTHGNIHDNGTIDVSSDSILSGYPPKNLLNTNKSDQYQSNGCSFAWILFDFKNMQVELSNYSIQSCSWSKNIGHIKSWVIEISDDKETWKTIDEHTNCQDLNGPSIVKTYSIQEKKFTRYIRFRHTEECWDGGTYGFNAIEFYGRLKTNDAK